MRATRTSYEAAQCCCPRRFRQVEGVVERVEVIALAGHAVSIGCVSLSAFHPSVLVPHVAAGRVVRVPDDFDAVVEQPQDAHAVVVQFG